MEESWSLVQVVVSLTGALLSALIVGAKVATRIATLEERVLGLSKAVEGNGFETKELAQQRYKTIMGQIALLQDRVSLIGEALAGKVRIGRERRPEA